MGDSAGGPAFFRDLLLSRRPSPHFSHSRRGKSSVLRCERKKSVRGSQEKRVEGIDARRNENPDSTRGTPFPAARACVLRSHGFSLFPGAFAFLRLDLL